MLRLIAGQIDEQFAAEIIADLATMDPKNAGRRNLGLAVDCLSELRRIDRAADAALLLLQRLIASPVSLLTSAWESAQLIGGQWPHREWLATYLREAREPNPLANIVIGLFGQGHAEVISAIREILDDRSHPFHQSAPSLLAAASPTETTLTTLRAHIENPEFVQDSIFGIAQWLKDVPGAMDVLFAVNSIHADNAISLYAPEDPRALPRILRVVSGQPDTGWLDVALLALEHHVNNPEARAALEKLAAAGNATAQSILARHPTDPA